MSVHLLLAKRVKREFYVFRVRKDILKTILQWKLIHNRLPFDQTMTPFFIEQRCTDAIDLLCIDDILNQPD